jgi:hypothetical protein
MKRVIKANADYDHEFEDGYWIDDDDRDGSTASSYFTQDEIRDFANEAVSSLNESYPTDYYISNYYIVDYNRLVIDIVSPDDESIVASGQIEIDMDYIRNPEDLINEYLDDMVVELIKDLNQYYEGTNYDIYSATNTSTMMSKSSFPVKVRASNHDYGYIDDSTETVELYLDTNIIVDDDDWDYQDESYAWMKDQSDDGYFYSEDGVKLGDHLDFVEHVDELLVDDLPQLSPGVYRITGDITLSFDITGVAYSRDYFADELHGGYDYDEELYLDDAQANFDKSASSISNLKVNPVE